MHPDKNKTKTDYQEMRIFFENYTKQKIKKKIKNF
jgi:hypothetical protein